MSVLTTPSPRLSEQSGVDRLQGVKDALDQILLSLEQCTRTAGTVHHHQPGYKQEVYLSPFYPSKNTFVMPFRHLTIVANRLLFTNQDLTPMTLIGFSLSRHTSKPILPELSMVTGREFTPYPFTVMACPLKSFEASHVAILCRPLPSFVAHAVSLGRLFGLSGLVVSM